MKAGGILLILWAQGLRFLGGTDILGYMSPKKQAGITPEEFRELMREIIKRFVYATILLTMVGVLIVVLMFLWKG